MFLNKSLVGMFAASAALATGVRADTIPYSESFETGTPNESFVLEGWTGYGTFESTANDRMLAAGTPISGTHSVHVAVDGSVEKEFGTSNGDAQLDMLVRVAVPDEALSAMTDDTAKFALAVDRAGDSEGEAKGTLKYWNASSSAWMPLSSAEYNEGQWLRVVVLFSSSAGRCKVSVDGNACVTETGFKAETGSETGGAWYPVIQSTAKIASMKVVGTTALDDVTVKQETSASYVPTYADASGTELTVTKDGTAIPMKWFDKNSVATSATTAPDGSGMSIAAKYNTGLDPNSGDKFEMKSMTMAKSGETVTATITIPACAPPSGSVKIQTKSGSGDWADGATVASGATTAPVTLPSGSNVTYFRMVLDK